MFCGKCGATNDDGAKFCHSCGNVFDSGETAQVTQVPGSIEGQPAPAKGKFNFKKIGIIAAAIVLLVIVFNFVNNTFINSPKNVLKKYITAEYENDFKKMDKYSAYNFDVMLDASVKSASKMLGMSKKEAEEYVLDFDKYDVNNRKAYFKAAKKETIEDLKEEFGSNYKIKVQVLDKEKIKSKELKEMKKEMRDSAALFKSFTGVSLSKAVKYNGIKKAVDYDVEITITGRDDEDTDTATYSVVKIGRIFPKWRVMELPDSIDF